jgi:protein-S-isoprenylcysteine O-methyltransferase Ste14
MMFVRMSPMALLVGLCLFVSVGGFVPIFGAYVALLWLMFGSIYTYAARRSPDLVKERLKPPSDQDKASRRLAVPLILGHYVVAGLDARFAWSAVPLAAQIAGFVFVTAGLGLAGLTVLANPYASSAVRVQRERKQTVISTGPYAIVRHPMYLGVLMYAVGSGPALGSWYAALPMLPVIIVFVRRTLIEEAMLRLELEGYVEYTQRVRWRIVPLIF